MSEFQAGVACGAVGMLLALVSLLALLDRIEERRYQREMQQGRAR